MNFQGRNLVLNAGCILLGLQSVLLDYKSLSLVNKTLSSWLTPPQKWGHSTILVQWFFSIRTRSLRDFLAMEIPSQVLVKTLWILTNTSPNSYLFENVSVSFHIKKTATFQKQATAKRIAWFFFCLFFWLIWVLFSRHTSERVPECCRRHVSASVYFSYWCSSEVISEKDAERKGVNEWTGVVLPAPQFRARTADSLVADLVLCGWLPDFKCSAAEAPWSLTDCLLHLGTRRWWVSDPLNKKPEHHMVTLKSAISRYKVFMKNICTLLPCPGSVPCIVFVGWNHLPVCTL